MAKTLTIIFGVILVLLGLVGFTSNALIGANAYFVADTVHNLIHIVLGGILLTVAFWASGNSIFWMKVIGAVIFLLGVIGILTVPSTGGSLLGIAYTNGPSDWLHLIAGVVVFASGMYSRNDNDGGMPPMSSVPSSPQRMM